MINTSIPTFTPEQKRFIEICNFSVCERGNFWRDQISKEIYCNNCFITEPIIIKPRCFSLTSHLIIINNIAVITRCTICSRNIAYQTYISDCDICWNILTDFWSRSSELQKVEIESFIEPTMLLVNICKTRYYPLE